MERSKETREGTAIALLLCVAACLLLNWPILSIVGDGDKTAAVGYLFFVWLCIIFCLALYCRKEAAKPPQELGCEDKE